MDLPTVMNANDLTSALASSQVQETTAGGGNDFLKMDFDTGEWLLGQDQDIVSGDEIVILTNSMCHGWILWSGGRPKKTMVAFTAPLPIEPEPIVLPNGDIDQASEARSFLAAMADDQTMIQFDSNSYGGRKGFDALLSSIKAHALEGSAFLYPKVKLTNESYPGTGKRSGKTNHNPIFEIVSWFNEDGVEEEGAAPQVEDQSTEEPAEEAQPKRQRRKRNAA
ncbi:hypothetical protein N9878_00640 [bacterium]|nr:hypothetical protein [bacterium]